MFRSRCRCSTACVRYARRIVSTRAFHEPRGASTSTTVPIAAPISALPSGDTDALRSKINRIELSRDDKAHRFIVTLNAFQDGNRLAYLALAIAIGLDGLIFMSGLFGANAVRSPLSDIPSYKSRSGAQLDATINAALDRRRHARVPPRLGRGRGVLPRVH